MKGRVMNGDHEKITTDVREFVESSFCFEIYDVTYKQIHRQMVLEVIIDSPDGVSVLDCETVSRGLGKYLDEANLIDQEYTLEVSSPGVERYFKRPVDYVRHIGKKVRFKIKIPSSDRNESFRGCLKEFSPECIKVQTEKGLREFSQESVIEAQAVFEFPTKLKRE
jgi:ribosome maturation factor RimP